MPDKTVDGVMLLSWVRNSTSAPISGGISVSSSGLRASESQWEQLLIYIGSRCDPLQNKGFKFFTLFDKLTLMI